MKTKKSMKKLTFKKKTIAQLTGRELIEVKGGVLSFSSCPGDETFDLSCDPFNCDPRTKTY